MNVGSGSDSARETLAAERAERAAAERAERAERLAAERAETRERLAGLEREFAGIVEAADSANTDDEHDPEGATIAFERQHVAALLGQARDHLAAIDAALRRLDEGGYGQCERCGLVIAPERLAARPTATRCVSCAGKQ
jgi:DnaK suppressor protein